MGLSPRKTYHSSLVSGEHKLLKKLQQTFLISEMLTIFNTFVAQTWSEEQMQFGHLCVQSHLHMSARACQSISVSLNLCLSDR